MKPNVIQNLFVKKNMDAAKLTFCTVQNIRIVRVRIIVTILPMITKGNAYRYRSPIYSTPFTIMEKNSWNT